MQELKVNLAAFLRDRSGASASQYALILALTGAAAATAALMLNDAIVDSVGGAAGCIRSAASCGSSVTLEGS